MAATRISRSGSFALTLALLAAIAVGAVLEAARARRGEATAFAGEAPIPAPGVLLATLRSEGSLAANRALRQSLAALEDRLGRESALSAALRPAAQTVLARALGYGNSQVVVGRQGWLYFRTEFDYLTGPPFLAPRELERRRTPGARYHVAEPDPVPGLVRLHDELAERGIELVFFPVPVKAQVHPEHLVRFSGLGAADAGEAAGLANPSFPELVRRLGEAGIPVYDALPELRAAAGAGEAVYFATDTHWNAAGMRVAAAGLARFLGREAALPPRPPAGLRRRSFPHQFKGDLTRMLGDGIGGPIFAPERIELDEIVGLGDLPYHTKRPSDSDVLLLGDSYSLIFASVDGGKGASFAEQLAFALDRPVRLSAKVAANGLKARVQWLRDDPAALSGARVVIYQVTARALSSADWISSPLQPERKKRRKP